MCCVQCIFKPWQIARLSFRVGLVTAGTWGAMALVWHVTTLLFLFNEWSYDRVKGRTLLGTPYGFLQVSFWVSIFVICFYVLLFMLPALYMRRDKHQAVVFVHSLLGMLLPFTVWADLAVFVFWSTRGVDIGNSIIRQIGESVLGQIITSCVWLPILVVCWVALLVYGMRSAAAIAAKRNQSVCDCGYDLRGSIAGGSKKCPECGDDIPERMLDKPPSIHVDS